MIELLNNLFNSGLYNDLYKAGLISSKVKEYYDIYLFVDAKMKVSGVKKVDAVNAAAVQFECGYTKIYKALSTIKHSAN